ncbi:MAG: Fe-S cluster assembly protein IscX [Proteobacteria bacterium]|nr:Fe-S cluster assembly protein IscX [Pseudomonadota bacterium]
MKYLWTDVQEIAQELAQQHQEEDPQYVRFTDLHRWVCALAHFGDDPKKCNEKILEAIQMAWIAEVE